MRHQTDAVESCQKVSCLFTRQGAPEEIQRRPDCGSATSAHQLRDTAKTLCTSTLCCSGEVHTLYSNHPIICSGDLGTHGPASSHRPRISLSPSSLSHPRFRFAFAPTRADSLLILQQRLPRFLFLSPLSVFFQRTLPFLRSLCQFSLGP